MKLKMNLLGQWIGAVAIAAVMPLAHANYTFSNGGFEARGTPWEFDTNGVATVVSTGARTGNNALQFKNTTTTDGSFFSGMATQMFSINSDATIGTGVDNSGRYLFEFWTKGDPLDIFSVTLNDQNGDLLTSGLTKGQAGDWTSYSAVVVLDADYTLKFDFGNVGEVGPPTKQPAPFTLLLDDISFTACTSTNCLGPQPPVDMPEPGSLFLVGAALAGLAAVRRKVRV
jgi:hypothetical protein